MATEIYERVKRYLTLLKKNFKAIEEKSLFLVSEKVKGKEVIIQIRAGEPWIGLVVPIISRAEIPDNILCKVHEKLLQININYAEVSFGIDKEGNVLATEEILSDALTLDVFLEEYNALPVAVEAFEEEVRPIIKEAQA
ncbi:MAG: hypothetical protein Q6351_003185 [Candidatus Njordarchaeum guaymaensis]